MIIKTILGIVVILILVVPGVSFVYCGIDMFLKPSVLEYKEEPFFSVLERNGYELVYVSGITNVVEKHIGFGGGVGVGNAEIYVSKSEF